MRPTMQADSRQPTDNATVPPTSSATPPNPPDRTDAASGWLTLRGIGKRYGATVALDGVDLEVRAGEIHALLGENGAGKSTLMHVLAGLTEPDAGTITLAGHTVSIANPRAARRLGIAMVHQHFTLVPAFTVAENLALDAGGFRRWGRYDAHQAAASALERARALGWNLDGASRIANLSVGAQQRVEIVKALATDARILIFDEPTAVLAGDEVEELFGVLRRLRDQGCAVILIAHKLAEILAVADRVTVLRRGKRVASCLVADTDARQLAAWMVGSAPVSLPVSTSPANAPDPADPLPVSQPSPNVADLGAQPVGVNPALTATSLILRGDRGEIVLRDLSLAARPGEIYGIGGVDGNGQVELAEALAGLRPPVSGALMWNGQPFTPDVSVRTAYIPQDRRRAGLAVTMSVEDNLLFEAVGDPQYRFGPFLRRGRLRRLAQDLIEKFDIRTPTAALPASALSGGNQQKIVVARALRHAPDWIVAMNPTRGLDIGATRFVHDQLRQARARGATIVLITTDLDELAALADRAAILAWGTLTDFEVGAGDATQLGLLLGGMERGKAGDVMDAAESKP